MVRTSRIPTAATSAPFNRRNLIERSAMCGGYGEPTRSITGRSQLTRALRALLAAALATACAPAPEAPARRSFQVRGETTKVRSGERLPERSPWFDGRVV